MEISVSEISHEPTDSRLNVRTRSLADRATWLAFALVLATAFATRAIWFGDPVAGFDDQLYSFIGWRMTHGELPYADWWDRKPFGLFAIFGLAHLVGGPGAIAYQALSFLFVVAGAMLVFDLGKRLSGAWAGAVSAAISVILLAAYGSQTGQSEAFWVPMMTGMVWLLSRPDRPGAARRAAWAMLLGGLALQVKYTVLPQCAILGLWALWQDRARGLGWSGLARRALLYAVLGLVPTLAVTLLYLAAGQFDAFWFANFVSFFDRIPADIGRLSLHNVIAAAPLLLLAVGGIYAAARFTSPADRVLFLLALLWLGGTAATVFLPATVYRYYFAAFTAPAALVAAPLFDRRGPGRVVPGLVFLCGLLWLIHLPEARQRSVEERAALHDLTLAITPHVGPDDCLWLYDGPTVLYRLTGSCVPTRYVYPDHLNNALERDALGVDQEREVARILATRPAVIVTASRAMTPQNEAAAEAVETALAEGYRLSETVTMHERDLSVWVRRSERRETAQAFTAS